MDTKKRHVCQGVGVGTTFNLKYFEIQLIPVNTRRDHVGLGLAGI